MILNRAERMLARRYLLPGKGEGFIFLVATISLIAVALGVAALIIVMSVMNGFRAELFDKIVGLNGHAVIESYDQRLPDWQRMVDAAKKTPGVTSALPLIETPLMATANGRFEGVLVRGMRVEDIRGNKTITGNVLAGDIRSVIPGSNRVAIGSVLAEELGAYPGSQITLWNPEGRSTVVGTVPREVTYTVGAVFEIGVQDYDKIFIVMPMQDAQQLLLMGDQVGMIELQTTDPDKVDQIVAPLQKMIQGKAVMVNWKQMNSALFQALEVERVAMFVVLSLIVLVAVFNIFSSLIMLVRAKTRDIAILADNGRKPAWDDEGVRDGRRDDRLARDRARDHPWRIVPPFPAGCRQRDPDRHRSKLVGSVGSNADRSSSQDRSSRDHGDRPDSAGPVVPRYALSRI